MTNTQTTLMLRKPQLMFFRTLRDAWGVIRWRMLVILILFGVLSTSLLAAFTIAALNVVVRRESSYLLEERISMTIDNNARLSASALTRINADVAPVSSFRLINSYLSAVWPESRTAIATASGRPGWLQTTSFNGMVVDHGSLIIRSFHEVNRGGYFLEIIADTPVTPVFLQQLSKSVGVRLSRDQPIMLRPYRRREGILGEITANFIPGSRRAIPVVVTARNWQTGAQEDWVICQLRLDYSRTLEDLSRMGLQPASWVVPFGFIGVALLFVYVGSFVLSIRLSQRIGAAIDGLSHAAHRVGEGDFSVQVAIPGGDQLGRLAGVFNNMTRDLQSLRDHEKQTAQLEWDLALAREVQQHLYPRTAVIAAGVTVWGLNEPARMVSGDLYEFFSFSPNEIGLLCADVSGKGVSAALMMAHLQALVRGRLLNLDEMSARTAPGPFITALNRDFYGRFGNNRYVTMFYAEFDARTNLLRYVNAGHCRPILISETGEVRTLMGGDLPVGIIDETSYQALEVPLARGCTLVIYTDGVTDALNAEGEPFGEHRLMSCCKSAPAGATGEQIGNLIADKVAEWAADVERFDDTTLLVFAVE